MNTTQIEMLPTIINQFFATSCSVDGTAMCGHKSPDCTTMSIESLVIKISMTLVGAVLVHAMKWNYGKNMQIIQSASLSFFFVGANLVTHLSVHLT